jgi:hypothetical protein
MLLFLLSSSSSSFFPLHKQYTSVVLDFNSQAAAAAWSSVGDKNSSSEGNMFCGTLVIGSGSEVRFLN